MLTVLNCGRTATGASAMITLESKSRSTYQTPLILRRCLINVGDSTQRFCADNRIKLSQVSWLMVTSLANTET